jgi:hypothetical protein
MKTNILISLIAMVAMAMVSSCSSYSSAEYEYFSYSSETQTAEQIGKNGFIIKTVKPGDTLWEYSEEIFGKGVEWREILKENPFLDNPERTYYDPGMKRWIVILFPGETVKIRGEAIHPSFTSSSSLFINNFRTEEKTTITWWVWVILAVLATSILLSLIVLRYKTRNNRTTERVWKDRARIIEELIISKKYGEVVHISWTDDSVEIKKK